MPGTWKRVLNILLLILSSKMFLEWDGLGQVIHFTDAETEAKVINVYSRVRIWIWVSWLSIQCYSTQHNIQPSNLTVPSFLMVRIRVEKHLWKMKWTTKIRAKDYTHKNDLQSSLPCFQLTNLQFNLLYSFPLFVMCHKTADRKWYTFLRIIAFYSPSCWVSKKKSALDFVTYVTSTIF